MRWVIASSLCVLSCYGPIDTAWSASFANAADDAEAEFVFVDVRDNVGVLDCPGAPPDIIRGPYQIRPEAPAGTIPTLDDGQYCFHATAVRSDCTTVAAGWLQVSVPRDEVSIVMTSMTGGGCNPGEMCVNGRCTRDDGIPVCTLGQAYCADGRRCCPGSNEEEACRFYDEEFVGCSDPL